MFNLTEVIANMKWFFCINESSLNDGLEMVRKMLITYARTNLLLLEPYLIYDGEKNDELTKLLNSYDVKIIYYRHRAADAFQEYCKDKKDGDWGYRVISSTYLRTEIPHICKKLGFKDEYVLYTDWDILFLKECSLLTKQKPVFLSVGPQFDQNDIIKDINAGIMVMNIPNMYKRDHHFLDYIKENFQTFVNIGDNDQSAIRTFYQGLYEGIPAEYNWKPYWGENKDAHILHFHVIKPVSAREFIEGEGLKNLEEFYNRNPDGYKHYTQLYENV